MAKDQVEAVKWYRKAAEQNLAEAQYNLGVCYERRRRGEGSGGSGEMVSQSRRAESCRGSIQFGRLLLQGEGVAKDQVEAVKWYRKAAEQNYAEAQYNLGVCYYNGEGVAKDWVEAYKWLLLAARQGDEDAKKNMTELESKLTPEQIAEGQKRARDFKPR